MQTVSTLSIDQLVNYALGRDELDKGDSSYQAKQIPDIVEWAEACFFLPDTKRPINLASHQKEILRLFSQRDEEGRFKYTTLLYSTIKKSGKTTISGLYARWAAECWGDFEEVYNLGNKFKQAKERAFKAIRMSLLTAPANIKKDWDIQATVMTHLPSGSIIEALPISAAGEAGGNQSLTVWTELWGFQYPEALLMYDELKPVPTRSLSQRFIDTYAGFKGVSTLLEGIWQTGLSGERLHDELPIYGNDAASMIAYIDSGVEARRMAWQIGEMGEKYYAEQELTEDPINFRRHHLNEWAESQEQLFALPLWDRLEDEIILSDQKKADVVIGLDASVSGDCTAAVAVTMDGEQVLELETHVWEPPKGGKIDYSQTLEPQLNAMIDRYRVVAVAYDPYQLHDLMTRWAKLFPRIEWYAFPQTGERLQADTALVGRVNQGTLTHTGNQVLRQHVQNADGKPSGDKAIRIVKRENNKPVDGVVALSMAAWKASQLFNKPKGTAGAQIKFIDRRVNKR